MAQYPALHVGKQAKTSKYHIMCFIAFLGYEDDTITNSNLSSHVASNNTLLSLYLSMCIHTYMYNLLCSTQKKTAPQKQRCGSDERTEANKETVNH